MHCTTIHQSDAARLSFVSRKTSAYMHQREDVAMTKSYDHVGAFRLVSHRLVPAAPLGPRARPRCQSGRGAQVLFMLATVSRLRARRPGNAKADSVLRPPSAVSPSLIRPWVLACCRPSTVEWLDLNGTLAITCVWSGRTMHDAIGGPRRRGTSFRPLDNSPRPEASPKRLLYVLVVISQLYSTIWLGDCACELPVVIAPIHGRTP
jgi:hypothetical protein